jgi:hypothetical protein
MSATESLLPHARVSTPGNLQCRVVKYLMEKREALLSKVLVLVSILSIALQGLQINDSTGFLLWGPVTFRV